MAQRKMSPWLAARRLVLLFLCVVQRVAAREKPPMTTAPPKLPAPVQMPRRAHPAESRADFVGWFLQANGGFSASFCWTQGETVTTIGTIIECCPPQPSSCYVGISCSSGYQVSTVVATPAVTSTAKLDCAAGPAVIGNYCASEYLYEAETNTSVRYVSIGCKADHGLGPPRRYYRTLTPGAETTMNEPPYSPGETATTTPFPTRSSASRSSSIATSNPNRGPSTGIASPTDTSSALPSAEASSSGALSRSDQIAIGIGLGIGLPTVLIGVLAWFYPRHVVRRGSASAPAVAGGVQAPAPAPAQKLSSSRIGRALGVLLSKRGVGSTANSGITS